MRHNRFIYGNQDDRGSIWTYVICEYLNDHRTERLSWRQVFDTTSAISSREFKKKYPKGVNAHLGGKQLDMNPYAWSLPTVYIERPDVTSGNSRPKFGVRAANTPFNDGVEITEIVPGGAGEAANLHVTDMIIEINGTPIRNEDDYIQAVITSPKTMQIKVRTIGGKILTGTAQL